MVTRRTVLGAAAALTTTAILPVRAAPDPAFVRREGTRLMLGGKPYRFAGANLWYAAWLGSSAGFGDRARLARELDTLAGMGVTNLRILASAEDSPLKNSVKPAFHAGGDAANP